MSITSMTKTLFGLAILLSGFTGFTTPQAHAAPWCSTETTRGDYCWAKLRELRPTQFAVGMIEVRAKQREFSQLSNKELEDAFWKNPIAVVVGPGETFFVVDRHHHALAVMANGEKEAPAQIVANYSRLSWDNFYKQMLAREFFYLYDENGNGPLSPLQLPSSLTQLKDDVYRSLSWGVREAGGFKKVDENYSDFAWANFFRARIRVEAGAAGFKKAVQQGVALARSPEARGLPGYIGK